MDKDTAKILETNVLERINKMYPVGEDGYENLANLISQIAVRSTIITLQEYEKLNANEE